MHTTETPDSSFLPADVADSNPSTDCQPEISEAASGAPNYGQPGTQNGKSETPRGTARRRRWQKFIRRGRPSTFNEEVADAMYESILETGVTDSRAGLLANVSTSTVSRWKQEDPGFAEFLDTARTHFEFAELKKIRHAKRRDGQPNAQNAKWLLQHTNPEVWGGRARKRPVAAIPVGPASSRNGIEHDTFATPHQSKTRQNIPEIPPTEGPSEMAGEVLVAEPGRTGRASVVPLNHPSHAKPAIHPAGQDSFSPNQLRSPTYEPDTHGSRPAQQSKSLLKIPVIPPGKVGVSSSSPSVFPKRAVELLVAGRAGLGESDLQGDLEAILARRRRERKALSRTSPLKSARSSTLSTAKGDHPEAD